MEVLRYAAFSADPAGGNPAGVVLDATGSSEADMLRVAADVGYSESAFLVPRGGEKFDVRYFSPVAEVAFCGHATIASAVAYAERHGPGTLSYGTQAGQVDVTTAVSTNGTVTATLISVPPRIQALTNADFSALLDALRWAPGALDP